MRKEKNLPHHGDRNFEDNFLRKNQQAIDENGLRMHHLHLFFKNFLGETPTIPPPLRKDKNFPSLALYDSLQLRWTFSCITYIEDRSFESKNYTKFYGEKSTRTRQKWAKNAPFASVFSKNFSGRPEPPPPYCEKIKKIPLFGFIWSSTAIKELPGCLFTVPFYRRVPIPSYIC